MTLSLTGVSRDDPFSRSLDSLLDARFATRLFAQDATLWGDAAAAEAATRLGWTDFEANAAQVIEQTQEIAGQFAAEGVDTFLLCGMGGSSLAPLMIAPDLAVLDSTHPDAVRRALESDLSRTAVIVSSKSGGTVETVSQMHAFEAAFAGAGIDPNDRIVIVTDPGSTLATDAAETGKRIVFADPNVGGRFSVFTAFGIVPSMLAGADMAELVAAGAHSRDVLSADSSGNPALVLAAALASGVPQRFVAELQSDDSLPAEFGLWIEQLVAESTGKQGTGVFPIALPAGATASGAATATLVRLSAIQGAETPGIGIQGSLGEQLLLWQVATAAMGFLLGVDPFNQPDVEAAKIATRESLGEPPEPVAEEPSPAETHARLRSLVRRDGYVGLQAYVDPSDSAVAELLVTLRQALVGELGVPVALGYGPRYLHSTGQFHKGGPGCGAFLQIIQTGAREVAIPGEDSGFGALFGAQARGDASVLRARGRGVLSVETSDPAGFLRDFIASI